MRKLTPSKRFEKDIKRLIKQNANMELMENIVMCLRRGEKIPDKNRDHKLFGNWEGFRGLHVASDWVLIYAVSDDEVSLARTGSHSELYDR